MWGIGNTLFNAALEAAAGIAVRSAVSFFIERRKSGSKRQLEAEAKTIASSLDMQEGLDVTLYSLHHELMKIHCAISAAKRRRITDKELLEWLAQIINASHLGNYYHRTFKHHNALSSMIESEGTNNLAILSTKSVAKRQRTSRTSFSGDEVHMKLHDVLKMVKNIDIHAFLLMVNAQPERPMKTYIYMEHNRLLNRDKERQQVTDFLFEPNNAGEDNVSILPIFGSGGVGKSSLVLHCFRDRKVQNHFSLKIHFGSIGMKLKKVSDFPIMLGKILKQYTCIRKIKFDVNTLLVMLKQKLSSERFLLVLDHVEDVDPMVWNALHDCLKCGKEGSKVIIISSIAAHERYKKIVNPGEVKSMALDDISNDEYIVFFLEHAFGGADPEDYPDLEKMGREIGKKMNGSIWAAKIIGELLRDNLNAPFWSRFLQGGILSPLERGKSIWHVAETMSQLLGLQVSILGRWTGRCSSSRKFKTFRELMVLGPNHCAPLIVKGKNCGVQFMLSEHVFLNRRTSFWAICNPLASGDEIEEDAAWRQLKISS
ncbi:hypothetical protein LUZ61_017077 [Rhynchospora tenuis]|uniref:NB-ARC domain-containing protein n=1 Tax=Rhynchospora tenuis TaxID=198213 RepID=A0AAD5Z6S4_9POAL|nr:hypothetical protein LUZ61_017077 [Rhynchospora tenuis]